MTPFFCESDLTEEQKSKWQELMNQYSAILRMNTIMKVRAMSDAERALCASILGITVESEKEFEEKFIAHSVDLSAFGGSPRSALFARLLSGKAPLPCPPPTNFGFPWYEVVEDERPFLVKVNPSGGDLAINQCRWSVVGRNESALRLLTFHEKASEGLGYEMMGDSDSKYLFQILQIYEEGPEFFVTYAGVGVYRLFAKGVESIRLRLSSDHSRSAGGEPAKFRSVFTILSDLASHVTFLDENKPGWYIQRSEA